MGGSCGFLGFLKIFIIKNKPSEKIVLIVLPGIFLLGFQSMEMLRKIWSICLVNISVKHRMSILKNYLLRRAHWPSACHPLGTHFECVWFPWVPVTVSGGFGLRHPHSRASRDIGQWLSDPFSCTPFLIHPQRLGRAPGLWSHCWSTKLTPFPLPWRGMTKAPFFQTPLCRKDVPSWQMVSRWGNQWLWSTRTHRQEGAGAMSANSKPFLKLMVKDMKLLASSDHGELRGQSLEFIIYGHWRKPPKLQVSGRQWTRCQCGERCEDNRKVTEGDRVRCCSAWAPWSSLFSLSFRGSMGWGGIFHRQHERLFWKERTPASS